MANDDRPIGVFDSGMGGISVLRRAILRLESESFIYYGDNLNAPYGDRSGEEICKLTQESVAKLLKREVKAILIACNTATAAVIDRLERSIDVPVIGTYPAILAAERELKEGFALMLSTRATATLPSYKLLRERLNNKERVIDVACPSELVRRIERAELSFCRDIVEEILSKFDGMQIDAIVLGCTHYPFIADEIVKYAKAHFKGEPKLYDGGAEAVDKLEECLNRLDIRASGNKKQSLCFMSSADGPQIKTVFDALLKAPPEP